MMHVTIILPVHNRREITLSFINQLKAQTHKDWSLILVDDGSTDGTTEAVKKELPSTIVLTGNGNLWWGGSLQKAYDHIKTSGPINGYVMIINDDVDIKPDFLEIGLKEYVSTGADLLTAICKSKETGALLDCGVYLNWETFGFYTLVPKEQVNCLSTRGLILRTDLFLKLGGFRPKQVPHYLSDYEFTHRAFQQGYKLKVSDAFVLYTDSANAGIAEPSKKNFSEWLKSTFSYKNYNHPKHVSAFISLLAPKNKRKQHTRTLWRSTILDGYRTLPRLLRLIISLIYKPPYLFISTYFVILLDYFKEPKLKSDSK